MLQEFFEKMNNHHSDIDWDNMEWSDDVGDFVPKKTEESASEEERIITKDANGKILETGDICILTKDLNVKGSTLALKRGTKVKIKLGDDPDLVECKIGKTAIFLKTCFLKK